MKRRLGIAGVILGSLTLAGCTVGDIGDGLGASCNFVANHKDLLHLAQKIGGTVYPPAAIPIDVTQSTIEQVCDAVTKARASKKESSISGVVVKGVYVRGHGL